MQMIRTFHPVGQGGFCTECFCDGSKVVYDCGTQYKRNKIDLIREIDGVFSEDDTIEAVFFSHMDADHINGLDYLLKFNIKNIYLPLMSEEAKTWALFLEEIKGGASEFAKDFISNPITAIRSRGKDTNVIYVSPDEELPGKSETDQEVIPSGSTLHLIDKWVYIPYNFEQKSRIKQMKKALSLKKIKVPKNGTEILELMKDANTRAEIHKIYIKEIRGSINVNSMTLYSGVETGCRGVATKFGYLCRCRPCIYNFPMGCIYMGDYDAKGKYKWNQFKKHYKNYLEHVGVIQVPHHGSWYNYNMELARLPARDYIVLAGRDNSYHHPHDSVVRDILFGGKILHIVTEAVGSKVVYVYGEVSCV